MIKQNSQNPILKSFSVHIQSAMKNLKFKRFLQTSFKLKGATK